MLAEVTTFYLGEASAGACSAAARRARLFATESWNVINPAEVEDIVALCETTALYRGAASRRQTWSLPRRFWTWQWRASWSASSQRGYRMPIPARNSWLGVG